MKINHKHIILILIGLICLATSAFAYIYIYQKTIKLAQNFSKVSLEMNSEDGKKKYEQELIKLYDDEKDNRERVENFLIKEDKMVNFIEIIENVGEITNTKLEISSLNKESNAVKAKVSVIGTWTGIMRALILIENLPVSSKISNVVFNTSNGLDKNSSEKKSSSANTWKLVFDIEAITIK